jgi:hypothetical protein
MTDKNPLGEPDSDLARETATIATDILSGKIKLFDCMRLEQVRIDSWKAEASLLIIKQCHYPLDAAIRFAEAAFENIYGDIETTSPQDCVDAEIDEMRSSC